MPLRAVISGIACIVFSTAAQSQISSIVDDFNFATSFSEQELVRQVDLRGRPPLPDSMQIMKALHEEIHFTDGTGIPRNDIEGLRLQVDLRGRPPLPDSMSETIVPLTIERLF